MGPSLTVVFISGNWIDANLVACTLRGHDIDTFLFDDNLCRMYPLAAQLIGGAKVAVNQQDAESARTIVGLAISGDPPFVGDFARAPLSLIAFLLTLLRRKLPAHVKSHYRRLLRFR